jgi:hypothetical protein
VDAIDFRCSAGAQLAQATSRLGSLTDSDNSNAMKGMGMPAFPHRGGRKTWSSGDGTCWHPLFCGCSSGIRGSLGGSHGH